MTLLKPFILLVWLVSVGAFWAPDDSMLAAGGPVLFMILVVLHLLECVIFLPRLRKASGSLWNHIGQTMLYGVIHLREVKPASQEGASTND